MAQTIHRSRLMQMSWTIQRTKNKTRSKSLQQAWALYQCEDIAVQYLTRKLNSNREVPKRALNQYSLFAR